MQSSKTPSERAPSVKPDEGDTKDAAENASETASGNATQNGNQLFPFPSCSELNGRLRRIIAACQRENKKEEMRIAAVDKRIERRERIEQVLVKTGGQTVKFKLLGD